MPVGLYIVLYDRTSRENLNQRHKWQNLHNNKVKECHRDFDIRIWKYEDANINIVKYCNVHVASIVFLEMNIDLHFKVYISTCTCII